jgi:5'-nucleotidase
MQQSHIVITNDDGIQSPALELLRDALARLGTITSITIVAPDREMSACSHSLTFNQPLRYHQIGSNSYSVQGTPADCVILASLKILKEKPDLVISGINRGLNIGDDIAYSGTVAGALEAALQGIPAIAASTFVREEPDFFKAADITARVAAKVIEEGLPPDVILNVNYPKEWNGGVRFTRQGRRAGKPVLVENLDPRGRQYFWLHEELHKTVDKSADAEAMTDYEAIVSGYVSISPLQLDRTAHTFLEKFNRWSTNLSGEDGE